MKPSWVPVALLLILLGSGVMTVLPRRWSPAPAHGILAGMAMYFVAFAGTLAREPEVLERPRLKWIGAGGVLGGIVYRAAVFLGILIAIAAVYFDRRGFFDVTWPLLILATWTLADAMLNGGRRGRRDWDDARG